MALRDFIAACSNPNESQKMDTLFLKRDYHSNMLQISIKIIVIILNETIDKITCGVPLLIRVQ